MFLADHTIEKLSLTCGLIMPYNPAQLQPASYDVRLASDGLRFAEIEGWCKYRDFWDLSKRELPSYEPFSWDGDNCIIMPGEFILGSTQESVKIPHNIRTSVEGKSSIARLGIGIHVTAGYVDPGFEGRLTLEIYNHSAVSYRLYTGMLIAQLAFAKLDRMCTMPYGRRANHYQGQGQTTPSRFNT